MLVRPVMKRLFCLKAKNGLIMISKFPSNLAWIALLIQILKLSCDHCLDSWRSDLRTRTTWMVCPSFAGCMYVPLPCWRVLKAWGTWEAWRSGGVSVLFFGFHARNFRQMSHVCPKLGVQRNIQIFRSSISLDFVHARSEHPVKWDIRS